MIDHWFGRILAALDAQDLWDDTAVDRVHRPRPLPRRGADGRDIWGKPGVPQLRAARPHAAARRAGPASTGGGTCDALTTSVDLFATHRRRLRRRRPSTARTAARSCRCSPATPTSVRDWAIGGVCGSWVHVTDGHRKYARAPGGRQLSRCRCGRTAGRRCRCTARRAAPAADPTTGPRSTACPARRAR